MSIELINPFTIPEPSEEDFLANIPTEDISPESFDSYLRVFLDLPRRLSEVYEAGYDVNVCLHAQPQIALREDSSVRRVLRISEYIFDKLYKQNTPSATALLSVFTLLHPALLTTVILCNAKRNYVEVGAWATYPIRRHNRLLVWVTEGRTDLFQLLLQRYTPAEWNSLIDKFVEERIGSLGVCDILELLLEKGFKPTWNTLAGAVWNGKIDIIHILFTHGLSLSNNDKPKDWKGDGTPLSAALIAGNVSIVRALLMYGADPRAINKKGNSVIMVALGVGVSEECVVELLNVGVDTSICNMHGFCPLFKALTGAYSFEVIKRIVECGADLDYRDCVGNTALRYVQGETPREKELREYFLSKGATDYGKEGAPEENRWYLHETLSQRMLELAEGEGPVGEW